MDIFRPNGVDNLIGSDKESSFTVKIAEQNVQISLTKIHCRFIICSCSQQTETNFEFLYSYTTFFHSHLFTKSFPVFKHNAFDCVTNQMIVSVTLICVRWSSGGDIAL